MNADSDVRGTASREPGTGGPILLPPVRPSVRLAWLRRAILRVLDVADEIAETIRADWHHWGGR